MAITPETHAPETPLKLTRLVIAALIVAPLASLIASLIFSGTLAFISPVDDVGSAIIGVLTIAAVATIVSVLFVFAALLLLALPLTFVLVRLGVPALTRNLILLAIGAGAAVLLWPVSRGTYDGQAWIFPTYALVAAFLWVMALRRMERRG